MKSRIAQFILLAFLANFSFSTQAMHLSQKGSNNPVQNVLESSYFFLNYAYAIFAIALQYNLISREIHEVRDLQVSAHQNQMPILAKPLFVFKTPSKLAKKYKDRVKDGRPAIYATERLAFVKKLLKRNPDLNMRTRIDSGDLWSFYLADRYFILMNTRTRIDVQYIQERMEELDSLIREAGWDQAMSFADYNFIAYVWSKILSESHFSTLQIQGRPKLNISTYFKQYQKALAAKKALMDFQFLNSSGIFFPHISSTGSISLKVLNDAWGFFVDETNNQASYVDFLAVGTNILLSFDADRDTQCYRNWMHDLYHSENAGRTGNRDFSPLELAARTAKFRERVLQRLDSDSIEAKLFELAFFEVFHENLHGVENLSLEIAHYQEQIQNVFNSDFSNHHYTRGQFSSAGLQYEANIKSALSLGVPIEGRNPRDYKSPIDQDQVCDYLRKLSDGLKILSQFADFYDAEL